MNEKTEMINSTNEASCPFCKSLNLCKAKNDKPCWCVNVEIPNQLIDLVPDHLQRKSCICQACINTFIENPSSFKSKFLG